MTHFEPGTAVTWLSVPRGGYGFAQPVAGVVVRSTSVRVIIRVTRRNGEQVERAVRPESLRPRREGERGMMTGLSLAQMIAQTDAGQDYVAWSRAHRRALQRGDAVVVRPGALMAHRAYTQMQRAVVRGRGQGEGP